MRNKLKLFSLAGIALAVSLTCAQIVLGSEKLISPLPDEALSLNYDVPSVLTSTPTPTFTPTPTPTNTPTPTPTATPTPSPSPKPAPVIVTGPELEVLFDRFSSEFGVDKEQLKRIAACESGFNSNASNGPYGGMYQFSEGSWASTRASMGADQNASLRFNPEEAIKTAAFKIKNGGAGAWPSCH